MNQYTSLLALHTIPFSNRFDITAVRNSWLLILVVKGEGSCRIQTDITNFQMGDCILSNELEQLSFVPTPNTSCEIICINFAIDATVSTSLNPMALKMLSDFLTSKKSYCYFALSKNNYSLFTQYTEICQSFREDVLPYSGLILEHTFYAFLVFLARTYFMFKPEKKPETKEQFQHMGMIGHVKQYIHQHYAEPLSLSLIADYVYTNPSYLSRIFKEQTGIALSGYLNQVRITNVKQLLVDTDELVVDIAISCGFNYISHFNRVFKELTGVTPKQYRHKHRRTL
jgi:AraC-like DNA-binding protein